MKRLAVFFILLKTRDWKSWWEKLGIRYYIAHFWKMLCNTVCIFNNNNKRTDRVFFSCIVMHTHTPLWHQGWTMFFAIQPRTHKPDFLLLKVDKMANFLCEIAGEGCRLSNEILRYFKVIANIWWPRCKVAPNMADPIYLPKKFP